LGTGNLKYPVDKVAKIMFQTVGRYSSESKIGCLKEVYFVIYERDKDISNHKTIVMPMIEIYFYFQLVVCLSPHFYAYLNVLFLFFLFVKFITR
jgi:hypothetical protein